MKFAFLIILIGLIATFLGSLIISIVTRQWPKVQDITQYWKLLLAYAVLNAAGLGLHNLSSELTGLTLIQVVKSALPLLTLIVSIWLEGITYSYKLVLTTILLVIGSVIALLHNPSFGWLGFLTAITSLVCQAFELVFLSIILQKSTLSTLGVALLTSLMGAFFVAGPFWAFEYQNGMVLSI